MEPAQLSVAINRRTSRRQAEHRIRISSQRQGDALGDDRRLEVGRGKDRAILTPGPARST